MENKRLEVSIDETLIIDSVSVFFEGWCGENLKKRLSEFFDRGTTKTEQEIGELKANYAEYKTTIRDSVKSWYSYVFDIDKTQLNAIETKAELFQQKCGFYHLTRTFDKFIENNGLGLCQYSEDGKDMELIPIKLGQIDPKIAELVCENFDKVLFIREKKKRADLEVKQAAKEAYLKNIDL